MRSPDDNVVPLRPGARPRRHSAEGLPVDRDVDPARLRATATAKLNVLKQECLVLSETMQRHAPAEVARMMAGLDLFCQSFLDVISKAEQVQQQTPAPDAKPKEDP